jgi:hypothetical protein
MGNELLNALLPEIVREAVTPAVFSTTETESEDELRIKHQFRKNGELCVKAALWSKATRGEVHEEDLPVGNAFKRRRFATACITALKGKLNEEAEEKLRKYIEDYLVWQWEKVKQKEEIKLSMQELSPVEKLSGEEQKAALETLRNPNLLYEAGLALQQLGLAGETRHALLLYLALTSRLTDDIINTAIKAESSTGKSFLVGNVLKLFPPEAYLSLSGMSKQALYYSKDDFRHRMLYIAEAAGMESAEYTIRTLLSEKRLAFKSVERNPTTGEHEERNIEKEGPTGMILTTTLPSLNPENETRFITLSLDESEAQTKRINLSTARKYSGASLASSVPVEKWQNAQRLLKGYGVNIPYAEFLATRMPTQRNRIRRDFEKLLSLISASALLHQEQRQCFGNHIEASLEDYFIVKKLFEETFFSSLNGLPKNTRLVMQAIKDASKEKNLSMPLNAKTGLGEEAAVTTKELLERLVGWSKGKILRAVKPLEDYGWVESEGEGKANEYRPGIEAGSAKANLPSVEEIAQALPHLAGGFNGINPLTGTAEKVFIRTVPSVPLRTNGE